MAISLDVNRIKESFGRNIVRPRNQFGIAGFYFDIERSTEIDLSSDITDHFVEDNTAVQDHIANKPKIVTLRFMQGELTYNPFEITDLFEERVPEKLNIIALYTPELTDQAEQARNAINSAVENFNNNVIAVRDLWSLTENLNPGVNRQQQAYLYFSALWEQKILVSVETPYEFFDNMAIMNIRPNQGEKSRFISDFSITLKQINFVGTQTVAFDASLYQSRNQSQRAEEVDKGKAQGVQTSLALQLLEGTFAE